MVRSAQRMQVFPSKQLLVCAVLAGVAFACSDDDSYSVRNHSGGASSGASGGSNGAGSGSGGQPSDGGSAPSEGGAPAAGAPSGGDGPGAGGETQSHWRPAPGASWQWQLKDAIDTSFDVQMYDIDLFDVPESKIDELHADGRIVVCYFSAGSSEDWRSDFSKFSESDQGSALEGWQGERWLDVRSENVREIMKARLDRAREKQCDGVEPDNVDGYDNDNGLGLTRQDQLDYLNFLAAEAHARSLSIGLKNALDLVPDLVGTFDWALNEECFAYDECGLLAPFIEQGKAVFHVEYGDEGLLAEVCGSPSTLGFSTLIKNLELDAWRAACP